ncbi:MAG: hypothetical protein K0B81_00105 [Candidatus Cloacimonetes bacterium]|nr:hypothetical protein [Candidatus Cloacimonadota bacterium]
MKTILLVLLLSLTTCSLFSEWTHLGLSNHFVLDLTIYEEYLYAATDNGIYKKNIDQEDTLWVHLGLEEQYVNCLTVLNHETIIAGMSFLNSEHPILRTDNGGILWYPFSEGIDPDDFYFQTLSIDYHPETPHIIFSTGISYVLRLIEPSNIWELVAGDWSMIALGYHFVKIHPEHPNLI